MFPCTYAPVTVGPLTSVVLGGVSLAPGDSQAPRCPQIVIAPWCCSDVRGIVAGVDDDAQVTLTALLRDQAGVVSRSQALATGAAENDVRRLLRRREWVLVHPGVYVDHTGELTWLQRAWAAVLFAWPAALSHESALRAADGPGSGKQDLVHVAVGRDRRVAAPAGIRVHRTVRLGDHVLWNLGPPRVRYEDAALDVSLAAPDDLASISVLAKAVGSRRTTAERMATSLTERLRTPRRGWLEGVLGDIASGTCSVLEHGYLTRVERPHGLPIAERQVRLVSTMGVIYRDARYETFEVELDGRLHTDTEQRDRDLDRDLDAAVDGRSTVRLGYGQVFSRPCATAGRVAALLRAHGWDGEVQTCGEACPARRSLAVTR